jgi:hypothetical protein
MTFAKEFLRGKVACVTGGATGIGRVIARALAAHGARVALASRKLENLEDAVREIAGAGGEALAVQTDVRDGAQCDAMAARVVERFGALDILVNNAGANFMAPAFNITPNGFKAVLETVLNGTFFCSKAAAKHMMDHGGGRIINMAATNGWDGSPLMAHSGAGKAGVLSLTETLAVEWAPFKITVNAVCPGPVSTPGANERLWSDPKLQERIARRVPLFGRMGLPEDSVGPVLFFCSDAAAYITGASLAVDGGDRLRKLPDLF